MRITYLKKMKSSEHLKAREEFSHSLRKLREDLFENRRMIVETCVLAAANLTNAALHAKGVLPEASSDIKHNRLFGYLEREKPVEEHEGLARCHQELESLKYSITHGITRNSEKALEAIATLERVEKIVGRYLEGVKR